MNKHRDSNFELLRIVAMMLVLLVHVNYLSLGNVTQSEIIETPWTAFVRIFCEQLCIVSVNLFVLLSGWFGIKPTIKKCISLLFQILFIGFASSLIYKFAGGEVIAWEFRRLSWFGQHYWFVPAYFILFFLSPVLNAFCERANKREFAMAVISFFVVEALFGWIKGDCGHYIGGYSGMSFIGLYLLAQYLRRHGGKLCSMKWWHNLLLYLLFTIIPVIISYCCIYAKDFEHLPALSYNSLFVVAASVSLLLMFRQFSFKSRIVNWLSASAFAIYLVHQAPGVNGLYLKFFKESYQSMHGALFIPFAILATSIIGLICVIFDKLRIVIWEQILSVVDKIGHRIIKVK